MEECPECGDEYEMLGTHWRWNPHHRPEFTQKQKEIVTGLLMGDGYISENGENCYMTTDMISPNYLEYLDKIFGVLGCGVSLTKTASESAKHSRNSGFRPNAKEENYSDIYNWRTRNHPKFNEFREWYGSGEKVWPEYIELTPTVLKHWYVGDGSYSNVSSRSRIRIAMNNEIENTNKVSEYFTRVGLPNPSNYDIQDGKYGKICTAQWTEKDSQKLFDYMGEPLPDFEYKWPEESR